MLVRAEVVNAIGHSVDDATEKTGWMTGVGWDVEVKVGRLFVEGGVKVVVVNPDSEVHKVNLVAKGTKNPGEFVDRVVHGSLEGCPGEGVGRRVCDKPDSKDVVNEASIEKKVRVILR